jgi:ABC-type branched-subunit amino acid transport system ATPase component
MSESLLIGAAGLTINFALALLAFRMVMKLDEPLSGIEPTDQPEVVPAAQALDQPAQA